MKEILFATTNQAKVEKYKKLGVIYNKIGEKNEN